ncbi:MAG: sigma-70 family RNA polymerase sigma factor [Sandaracinus sp.]|nr:sigma-70 family RNA polymerase sigma factor [Myxococcales bacterium]MCB9632513.1 sigma-70 family RNA polymerase sigma factor [Sandaracinus sp.]
MTEGALPRAEIDVHMARLAAGDRDAFTLVFEAVWPRMFALCRASLENEADASDAAQQAMMKLMERASDYDADRPALPWALAIAAWECRTVLRRRARRREVGASEMATEAMPGSTTYELEPELVRRDLVRRALEAMNELSADDRATLAATFFEESTDAAGATLRQRKARALDRLRAAMRRLYGL